MLRQAGFLNRPSPPLARRQRENAQQPTQNVVKLDQAVPAQVGMLRVQRVLLGAAKLKFQAFSWGPSKDVLREHNSNDDAGRSLDCLLRDSGHGQHDIDLFALREVRYRFCATTPASPVHSVL